jgi:hypothetical protein
MNQEPILIAGIDAIARTLGLSPTTVEKEIIGRPGFPACQLKPRGQWLTTRQKLSEWAEGIFSAQPQSGQQAAASANH